MDDHEGSSVVDRRRVVFGLAALVISAGCGGSSSKASPAGAGSSSSGSSPASSSSSTSASSTSEYSSPASAVPADQRIPDDVIASDADGYNGTWSATFTHADGTTGPLSVVVAIAPTTRTASGTINVGAGFFGPGSAAASEKRDYNLDDFGIDQQDFSGTSQLFGTGTLRRPQIGSGKLEIKGTQLPGRPDIASIDITTARLNFVEPHPVQYTIAKVDGTTITGTATFDL